MNIGAMMVPHHSGDWRNGLGEKYISNGSFFAALIEYHLP